MKTLVRIAVIVVAASLFAGCGFKGPLKLPDDAERKPPVDVSKDADATDVKKNPDT